MKEIRERLGFLQNVGLAYLTLARSAATLSGGESQRIRLATQIGSPHGRALGAGRTQHRLHQRDNEKLIATLKRLRDLGNTLIVVEHDEDTMRAATTSWISAPAPACMAANWWQQGTVEDICKAPRSITGLYLSRKKQIEVPQKRRKGNGHFIEILGATQNNLKNVNVKIPLGVMTV